MPKSSRPPEIWSTVATSLASITGWYSGAITIPVSTRSRVVAPAAAAMAGNPITVGRGGFPSITCSPIDTRSNPMSSARRAKSGRSQKSSTLRLHPKVIVFSAIPYPPSPAYCASISSVISASFSPFSTPCHLRCRLPSAATKKVAGSPSTPSSRTTFPSSVAPAG